MFDEERKEEYEKQEYKKKKWEAVINFSISQ